MASLTKVYVTGYFEYLLSFRIYGSPFFNFSQYIVSTIYILENVALFGIFMIIFNGLQSLSTIFWLEEGTRRGKIIRKSLQNHQSNLNFSKKIKYFVTEVLVVSLTICFATLKYLLGAEI